MSEFIVTESAGDPGEYGELQVIDALRTALRKRDTVVFWRYPLNTRQGQLREPDLLLLDPEWGVVVIEVKDQKLTVVKQIPQVPPLDTQAVCDLKANPNSNIQYEIKI